MLPLVAKPSLLSLMVDRGILAAHLKKNIYSVAIVIVRQAL